MSIRLIQVSRDLNVGLSSIVEFLHKKGFNDVPEDPNAKIGNDQFALVVEQLGKDLTMEQREAILNKRLSKARKKVADEAIKDSPEKEKEPATEEKTSKVIPDIKAEVPAEYSVNLIKKGHIDLDDKGMPQKHTKKEPPIKEIEQEKVVEQTIKEKKKDPEKKEENLSIPENKIVREEVKPVEPSQKQETKETKPKNTLTENKEVEKEQILPEKKETKAQEEKPVVEKSEKANNENKKVERKKSTKSSQISSEKKMGKEEKKKIVRDQFEEDDDGIFRIGSSTPAPKIKVKGKIDLDSINQSTRPKKKTKEERRKENEERKANSEKNDDKTPRKRRRIRKQKVDITKADNNNNRSRKDHDRRAKNRRPVKAEISEEDVQRQIKETLARIDNKHKGTNKSARYRREKRDEAYKKEMEIQEQEQMDSKLLKLTEFVTANDLANMMDVPVNDVISTCMSIGIMVSINQRLDAETITIVAEEFGFETEFVSADVVEQIESDEEVDSIEDLEQRPPIVTVMGHVDHGKTSLLDNIRNANVIAGEAGGITQHIGAYNVKLKSGRRITFLDTPGHEAFTAMRARGAKVTDIAIIIVAADDSVMPQTVEAINHASAAGVPIVFAINKIDKPHANPDKIKEELAKMNYLVEDWGGKYQSQEISAKKGIGVEELLEKVLLEADLLDLKANPNRHAVGSIIESSLDRGRGYVSTVLVQNGTLKMGDVVLAGTNYGRIKAMFNERNQKITEAGPSGPALILGLNGAPQAGDSFNVFEVEQEARELATRRDQLQREQGLRTQKMLTLDDIGRRIAIGNFQQLNIIVKGDVDGSIEALSDSLIGLSTEEIQVNVIHKAVGQISESDVVLAEASDAIIIGFQVRPATSARKMAENAGVDIRLYSIIYDAIDEVRSAMEGMLSPEIKEKVVATVEIREVYKISKVGTIAGCMVKEGKIKRSNKINLIRDGIVVYSGELASLKRYKDDVKEVVSGYECGLNIANYNDIKVGDIIEAYEEIEVRKKL